MSVQMYSIHTNKFIPPSELELELKLEKYFGLGQILNTMFGDFN